MDINSLSENQKKIFNSFLDDYEERLSNDGCNDLILEKSKENFDLICSAWNWNCKNNEVERNLWIEHYKKQFEDESCKKLVIYNGLIFSYLRHLGPL